MILPPTASVLCLILVKQCGAQCDQMWQHFKSLWLLFEDLASIGQKFESTFAQSVYDAIGQIFIFVDVHKLNR